MSAPAAVPEFDVAGELPSGVTVLEASAGTGKTHTIATLAARYVADGVPLDRMLLVTFTRIATGELRERVRERLVELERGLAARLAGDADPPTGDDPVVARLVQGDGPLHRERLAAAIAGFDGATIATTHSFCQEMLTGLGVAGDLERDVTVVEELPDLREEVLGDLYVRKFRADPAPSLDYRQADDVVREALRDPSAPLVVPDDGGVALTRTRLAQAARDELEQRKRHAGLMGFDDLVHRLEQALDGENGEAARAQLGARYAVVLVDEFQDTDPLQWRVLELGFAHPGTNLVLIADPKQAIYAFRGADVYAYLRAIRTADAQATLLTNWRSDQRLLDGHDALFDGAQLGHAGIAYRRVRAAPGHEGSRLEHAPAPMPLRFRVVPRDSPELDQTRYGTIEKPSAEAFIARDLAGDAVALLASPARVPTRALDASRPVAPGDLAVLVRSNYQAELVRDALHRAGVPAVVGGAGSVFQTPAAREWLTLLEALERPSVTSRAHAAALTCFIGWPAWRLATAIASAGAERRAWEDTHQRLHEWARILRARGVASLTEAISAGEGLPARVLAQDGGERRLTDVRHVAQLLHAATTAEELGPTALAGWLRARIQEADRGDGDEERTRRLESDDAAVQVLTIHRSKGAEFPIVYVPYMWAGRTPWKGNPVYFHDPAADDERRLDVGGEGPAYDRHLRQLTVEERGEELRLLYVALTRARHQTVVWWAASANTRHSPLTRLLFARGEDGTIATDGPAAPSDAGMLARLRTVAQRAPDAIGVETAALTLGAHWDAPPRPVDELDAARFTRSLDLRWRRTSYTDITAASYDAAVSSEPEAPLLGDEPDADAPTPASARADAPELSLPALLGEMPLGAEVGTFVHRVLEAADFAATDLRGELDARIAEVRARRAVEIGDPAAVSEGLAAMLSTPLGEVLGGRALRDLPRGDRLDELAFELPLAGGDTPAGWVTLERIAAVLDDRLPARDPLAGYARRLADPFLRRSVRGYLTGSLDLVARVPAPELPGGHRYAVLDYKTNWLGEPDEPLTAYHYRADALLAEMYRHHYALQGLLYTVALHRFLRWRLDGYDPDLHLAGIGYLFVRGMTGGDGLGGSGAGCPGVFAWRPPRGLPAALSDALAEGVGE